MRVALGPRALTLAFLSLSLTAADVCPPGYAPISTSATLSATSTESGSTTSSASSTFSSSVSSSSSGSPSSSTTVLATISTSTSASTPTPTLGPQKKIVWQNCGITEQPYLECATLNVPLDYTAPLTKRDALQLELALIRVPATSPNPRGQSIIYNPGGPGESGILSLMEGWEGLVEVVGNDWHLVSFDPRGVNNTLPYGCQDVEPVEGSNLPLDDPQGLKAAYDTYVKQASECLTKYQRSGELLGTAFVARDIYEIVKALGEDGLIRYWGFSYGTLLGATLSAMFPSKIDRVVLDGNINPTDYYHGLGSEAIADVEAALAGFFAGCAAFPQNCAIATAGSTGPQLQAVYLKFLDDLKSQAFTTIGLIDGKQATVGYQLVKGELFGGLKTPLTWPQLATNIKGYYQSKTPAVAGNTRRQLPVKPFVNVKAPQALNAITCGDSDRFSNVDVTTFKSYLNLYNSVSTFGGDQLISLLYACSTWQINAKEKYAGTFNPVKTLKPLLFVNSPYDPVTPLVSAVNSSKGFVDSVLVQHDGYGHCSNAQASMATASIVREYFNNYTLPAKGTVTKPDVAVFDTAKKATPAPTVSKRTPGSDFDEEALRVALIKLQSLFTKRDSEIEYPAFFRNAKRNVYEILDRRAPILIPAFCTPITSSTTLFSTTTTTLAGTTTSALATTTDTVSTLSTSTSSSTTSQSVSQSGTDTLTTTLSSTSSITLSSTNAPTTTLSSTSSTALSSTGAPTTTVSSASSTALASTSLSSTTASNSSAASTSSAGTTQSSFTFFPNTTTTSTVLPSSSSASTGLPTSNLLTASVTTSITGSGSSTTTATASASQSGDATGTATSQSDVSGSATLSTSALVTSAPLTTQGLTTSTVFTTQVSTIYSCAPTVTNCPYSTVVTKTIPLYTTVCPITAVPSTSSSSAVVSSTVSTVYTTRIYTITSCAATVTNCPYGSVTTQTISLYTTVCPVTPVKPTMPVTPVQPTTPVTPVKPTTPVTPITPITSATGSRTTSAPVQSVPSNSTPPKATSSASSTSIVQTTVTYQSTPPVSIVTITSGAPCPTCTGKGGSSTTTAAASTTSKVIGSAAGKNMASSVQLFAIVLAGLLILCM